jgi:hypothetical protein
MGIRVLDGSQAKPFSQGNWNPESKSAAQQERNCFPEIMKAKAKAIYTIAELRETKDTTHLSFFTLFLPAGRQLLLHPNYQTPPDSPPIPSTSLFLYSLYLYLFLSFF